MQAFTDRRLGTNESNDEYQLSRRFSEDALSSWQDVIDADLAVELTDALRTAQLALNDRGNQSKRYLVQRLTRNRKVRSAFTLVHRKARWENYEL